MIHRTVSNAMHKNHIKEYTLYYNMYIRIEFENIDSHNTKKTRQLFFSCPNGMFLSSSKAYLISSNEIREAGRESVVFWYLDTDILHKYYNGVMKCLDELREYQGVRRVDILPVEGNFIGKRDELLTILMQYINGVHP
jgi:hypothetical protein